MLNIRKAELKDYQTIIEIMRESVSDEEVKGFVPQGGISLKFLEELKLELTHPDNGIIIAEKEGVPVGFAFYRLMSDSVEIEEIDVRKNHQRQGVGKTLVNYIEGIAKEKRLERLITGTSVNQDGEPWKAYEFWIHIGFIDTGERIDGLHGLKYVRLIKQLH